MKLKSVSILFLLMLIVSCQNDNKQLIIEQQKEAQKKEVVFKSIEKSWIFNVTPLEPETQANVKNWVEWQNFMTEIHQNPKSSIGAFQKKAAILSKKVTDLNTNIPPEFNKPQIKARIAVLNTKIKLMDLYIHLNQIPSGKVVKLIGGITTEIDFFQLQMEEIVKRNKIPVEEGEDDIIRMKDASRAIPNELK